MAQIINTLKRVYTDDGAIVKHLCWLILAAIGGMLSTDHSGSSIAFSILFWLIMTVYAFGYNSIIMHNRFEEEGKPLGSISILPEFDILPFKIFLRAFPLIVVWIIYTLLLNLAIIIPIIGLIFCLIVIPFIAFVQVAYSKGFKTEGLYNLAILAKFIRLFWKSAIWWWFKLFLLGLVILAVLAAICIPLGVLDFTSMMITGEIPSSLGIISIVIQYISFVLGFVNAYGLADIYLKNWDSSSY